MGDADLPKADAAFQRGWDVQAGRARFPKKFEQEADVHKRSAEELIVLSPDDV
jgi:hypothetical protein